MEFIKIFIIGIIVGIANVIPGVSGGTLIVVFNIYDKFVNAISLNFKKLKENWKFLVPFVLGLVAGILIFSKLITILYSKFPSQTNYFFTGLIIGSIPLLFGYLIKDFSKDENTSSENLENQNKKKFSVGKIISLIICFAVGMAMILSMKFFGQKFEVVDKASFVVPEAVTFGIILKSFIGGIIGAVAMVIPGISGSLLLLMLGIYQIVIPCISGLLVKETFLVSFIILIPLGIGVLIGLFSGAKALSVLLKKVPNQTYAVILGLIVGSIAIIFPGFNVIDGVGKGIGCVVCVILGFLMAFLSGKYSKK